MAESSLAAAYRDLTGDVSFFLGFGRGPSFGDLPWTQDQQNALDRCVKGGIRKVYFCGYPWSFLKPFTVLTLPSGQTHLPLPDDFAGMEGEAILVVAGGSVMMPLSPVGPGTVYAQQHLLPTSTGRPVMVTVEPLKGTQTTAGQRFQMTFWPIADQDYGIQFQYYLLPDYLNGSMPYVYGGAQHAETFLAACKAVAELDLDDQQQGPQQMEFMRLLEVSKVLDARLKPQLLGEMTDLSDYKNRVWNPRYNMFGGFPTITVGGITPG